MKGAGLLAVLDEAGLPPMVTHLGMKEREPVSVWRKKELQKHKHSTTRVKRQAIRRKRSRAWGGSVGVGRGSVRSERKVPSATVYVDRRAMASSHWIVDKALIGG